MTVSSQTSNETFDGNGVTTIWDLPFRFFNNADIFVYLVDPVTQSVTPLVLGTDYTLTGAGLPEQFGASPGKITTTVPVLNGKQLFVERVMEVEQLTDIVNQGRFFPEVHEDVFDRLTMLIQQGITLLGRALVRPSGKDDYDAKGHKIVNLGDGAADQDAVNIRTMRGYVDAAIAGIVGGFGYFLQAGIGAVLRTFQGKMRDGVSVKDFGAAGNGLVDDAAAIRLAIAHCLTVTGGSKLVFPMGTYAIGSQVDFPKTVDTTMTVVGDRAVIKRFGSYTGTLFYFGEASNTVSTAPTHIEGFIFSGPYLTPDVSPMVKLQHSNGTILEKCVFQSGTTAVSLDESYAVRFVRCQFAYQKSYGITSLTPCMNLLVDACQFSDIAAGQAFGSDIRFEAITHNINIINSDFEGGRAAVLSADAVNAFNFVGNYIEGKTALPFFLGARSRGVKIENNWIGYNPATQTWYNITGGSLKYNIYWDQVQAIDFGPSGTQCIGVDVGSNVFNGTSTVVGPIWTNPTPINGYTNVGSPYPLAGYHQSEDGLVKLRGMVTGAADNSCFVLPVGLRPSATIIFPANGSTRAAGNVTVAADGNVTCFRSSNGSIDLSCVSFYS